MGKKLAQEGPKWQRRKGKPAPEARQTEAPGMCPPAAGEPAGLLTVRPYCLHEW